VTQRTANPRTPVRFRPWPPPLAFCNQIKKHQRAGIKTGPLHVACVARNSLLFSTVANTRQKLHATCVQHETDYFSLSQKQTHRSLRGDGLTADTCSHTAPIAVWCLGRGCNHHILDVNANSNNVTVPSLGQWPPQPPRKKAMCLTHRGTMVLAALLMTATLAQSPAGAYERPYDPYKWCAVGSDATYCGFLTLEQCRMSSRNCEPNQFYNPRPSPSQRHRPKPR
jgi:hypothetical protein